MDVQLPDGTTVQGVPEGTTKAQLAEKLKANGREVPADWMKESKPETSLGEKARGVGEGALSVLTGGAGALGGGLNYLGTLAATRDPKAAKAVQEETQERLTYRPRTEYGREAVENLAKPLERLSERAEQAGGKVTDVTGSPLAGAITRTGIEALPLVAPGVPKAVKPLARGAGEVIKPLAERVAQAGETRAAVESAQQATRNTAIENAKSLGLRLMPTQAGGMAGKLVEGASGSARLADTLSRRNAPQINRAAAQDIGVGETEPLMESLPRKVQEANQKYATVRGLGKVSMDDTYRGDLAKVKETKAQEGIDFPEDLNEAVEKEIKKFAVPTADADSMMTKIIKLRQRATKNIKTGDAEKAELGYAQKKIATAMEDQLERRGEATGQGQVVQQFREGRVQLAKIHQIDEALDSSGNISAKQIARARDRGEYMSGNLTKIADAYGSFPKVLQDVEKLPGRGPFTVVDYFIGLGAAAHNPLLSVAVAARPFAREVLASRAYQRTGIGAKTTRPSVVTRTARKIAGPRVKDVTESKPHTVSEVE